MSEGKKTAENPKVELAEDAPTPQEDTSPAAVEPAGADDGEAAGEPVSDLAPEGADDDVILSTLRLAELEGEVADLKDKLLRALAETENVRRRAMRDREDAAKYATAGFAREMLPVADNLRRALESVDGETREQVEALDALVIGIEMTEREMLNAFERAGIKPVEALDRKFDHNLHEALFEMEDPSRPAGTVVQVIQSGYVLHERLLRPAKVGVSKGGAKPEQEEIPPEPQADTSKDASAAYEKKAGDTGSQFDEET
jgi:molecular chaperone GrpE